MKLALIQLNSTTDIAANIAAIEPLIKEAADGGAELVATPEMSFAMEAQGVKTERYTQTEHPGVIAAQGWAKKYHIWLLIGSVAVIAENNEKLANRSLLFNPDGDMVAAYDKIHLFDVEVGDGQTYHESARYISGNNAVLVPVVGQESWVMGMTICYDLRFPHLYRKLAQSGAHILAVPSAFTQKTGEAHWHALLKARAIENGSFVIAPAQTGTHAGGRQTYGHSLVVSPWGEVLADGGTDAGVVTAEIDLNQVNKVREQLPSLTHDRLFTLSD